MEQFKFKRWLVSQAELSEGLLSILALGESVDEARGAWVLVRVFGEPVGWIKFPFDRQPAGPSDLRRLIPTDVSSRILLRLGEAGIPTPDGIPLDGWSTIGPPGFVTRQERVKSSGPTVTAVICTRDHPEGLQRCLQSLQSQDYPRLSIMVVDNAPTTNLTALAVEASDGPHTVSYVLEPKPGLSRARNRSIREVDSEIIAWIDDDEIADHGWAVELAGAFQDSEDVCAVCGIMLPGELDTPAQIWFEQYGGHNKGRGFDPEVFSPATAAVQHPLFPLPPFGTGGNMAMRTAAVGMFGEFDPALGAGTRSMGGEDTRAITDLLLAGGTVRYQPTAVTWHFHRRDLPSLERQLYGYGVGLAAFYASVVMDRPRLALQLVKLAPNAWREYSKPNGARLSGLDETFPAELLKAQRRGMIVGAVEYFLARLECRRDGN